MVSRSWFTVTGRSAVLWPALPHNPYRKDGRAEAEEGRIVVTLPFSRDVLRQEVMVKLAG